MLAPRLRSARRAERHLPAVAQVSLCGRLPPVRPPRRGHLLHPGQPPQPARPPTRRNPARRWRRHSWGVSLQGAVQAPWSESTFVASALVTSLTIPTPSEHDDARLDAGNGQAGRRSCRDTMPARLVREGMGTWGPLTRSPGPGGTLVAMRWKCPNPKCPPTDVAPVDVTSQYNEVPTSQCGGECGAAYPTSAFKRVT